MRQSWIKITVAVGLILLPIVVCWYRTTPPREITLAIGPQYGRYTQIMENLKERIERDLDVTVHMIRTQGSVENLRLVQEGIAHFALYQSGTQRFLGGSAGIFTQLNDNKDDRLSLEEFQTHRDNETAEEAFEHLDTDSDGTLTREEFSKVPAEVRFVANTHSDVSPPGGPFGDQGRARPDRERDGR